MEVSPLIRTKLAPPRLAKVRVAREVLLSRLNEHHERCVTLILGPAGGGKTTLAAMWRQQLIAGGADVAWYNVSVDDDATQWAAYLVASLQHAGVDIGPLQGQKLLREAADSSQRFVVHLVNLLFAHPRPIYLFLEDAHFLRFRPPFEVIEGILENQPPNLHVVITARSMPEINLAARQRRGQVLEINFSHLRFTPEEQVAYFAELGVKGLTEGQAGRLYALTEGWAVGTQLAAWSLKRVDDFETAFARMTRLAVPLEEEGSTGYLEDTIASIIEPQQLEMLVRMAAFRRINRELCDVIFTDAAAGELLETLGTQNLFLLPIETDDAENWYRFHRIFASFLRQRLRRLPADELKRINRNASTWFEAHGLYVEAIRHARYAYDIPRQVELLSAAARPLIRAGQFIQLLRLVADMPAEAIADRMQLLLCIAWSQISSRRLGAFVETLAPIEQHPEYGQPEVDFEVRELRALYRLIGDDPEDALQLLAPYIDQPPATDGYNLLMLGLIAGSALIGTGQYDRARDVVGNYQIWLRKKHGIRSRPYLDSLTGLSLLVQGDYIQAREMLERLMANIEREGGLADDATGHIAGYLAEVTWQLGDLEAASDYVDAYLETADIIGIPDCTLYALRTRARLHFEHGDLPRALDALDELERLAQDENWERLVGWSLAERVRLLGRRTAGITTMREVLRRLNNLAARYPRNTPGSHVEIFHAAAIADIDAAVAEFKWQHVAEQAPLLAETFTQRGRIHLALRMRVLTALALHNSNDVAGALALARPIVVVASQHGMCRLFIEEGEAGQRLADELLGQAGLSSEERFFLQTARRQDSHNESQKPQRPEGRGGKDILSPREREIVMLLSRALSGKTIARSLNVSPGTIKWHLKNIYGKLGAVSREDAVAKALELGVLC